jgi:hypothetical protein
MSKKTKTPKSISATTGATAMATTAPVTSTAVQATMAANPATQPVGFQFNTPRQATIGGISPPAAVSAAKTALARAISPAVAGNTVEGPASIVELARALNVDSNGAQLIFEYVYNNIDWEPGWGVQKGALGCLTDGMGNSFDQSLLLANLLRQAGFTANIVMGTIRLLDTQYEAWWNVPDIWGAQSYCLNQYIPIVTVPTWNGTQYYMDIRHVWVEWVNGATTTYFDPSIKTYSRKTGLTGTALASALGYTASTFLSDAEVGATIDPSGNFVQSINRTNIRNDMKTFTSNLVTYIKNNAIGTAPAGTATVDDVLGGQTIVPVTLPVLNTTLGYEAPGDVPTVWTGDVPAAFKPTLEVQFPNWSNPSIWDFTWSTTSDLLAGNRLTLFYSSLVPSLYLNGTAVATGLAQPSGTYSSIFMTVTHPAYAASNYPQSFQQFYQTNWQWWQSFIYAGQSYLIANAWGNLGRGQLDYHMEKLAANQAAGGSSSSEPVLGEFLAVAWASWAVQNSRVADLTNRIMQCHTVYSHQVGVIGYNNTGIGLTNTDLGGVSGSSDYLPNDGTYAAKTAINDTVLAMHGVALESAVLGQIVGTGTGACTTTVIDAANTAGNKIYKGTSTNWTGTVAPALTANGFASADLTNIQTSYINAGDSVVIEDHPTQTIGSWQGWGYWAYPTAGAIGIINGGLKGGENPGKPNQPPETPPGTDPQQPHGPGTDPIGWFTGDYIYEREDITVGSQNLPYKLSFTRQYDSANQYINGPLGRGWTHNLAITATTTSDGLRGMADQFAIQGAVSIAELYVSTDTLCVYDG